MSDPITFEATSARFSIPLLFVGQAQKEDFVNEAFAILDGLLHCSIEEESNAPPTEPADGDAWLVGSSPSDAWAGHAGQLALRQLGQWLFVTPRDGMQVLNKATGQRISLIEGVWHAPEAPLPVTGGTVVDTQARAAIAAIVAALKAGGVLPA